MFHNEQDFSFKHFLPLIGICLCLGVLVLLGSLYLSKQKSSNSQPEERLLAPTTTYTYLSLAPTPTLAPGQKAIYTFYIQATSHKADGKALNLTQTNTGKIFTVDIGTLISLNFGVGKFRIATSSPQDIFESAGSQKRPIHLPLNTIGAFRVIRTGFGTVTVIEAEKETNSFSIRQRGE